MIDIKRFLIEWVKSVLQSICDFLPVRLRPRPSILHFLVQPLPGSTYFGAIEIWGWAVTRIGAVERVEVFLNDRLLGHAMYGFPSPDVAAHLNDPSKSHCSYSARFIAPPHLQRNLILHVRVRVITTAGQVHERSSTLLTPDQAYARWLIRNHDKSVVSSSGSPNIRLSVLILPYASSEQIIQSLTSIYAQSYPLWEALVSVPPGFDIPDRVQDLAQQDVRTRLFEESGDECSRAQALLSAATGDYVVPLVPGALLAPHALASFAQACASANADLVYSDHDHINDQGQRFNPRFKPDWSPEYLRGTLYIGPAFCVRRGLAIETGGFAGSDDVRYLHDMLLRTTERAKVVHHIPDMLVHLSQPVEPPDDAAISAVKSHLERLSLPARVRSGKQSQRLIFDPLPLPEAGVSIVIPTRDAPGYLSRCLESIFTRSSYRCFEVILVDNDTCDPEALAVMQRYPVKRVPFPGPFNYSRANNLGAAYAQGEYLLFLNNDTEVLEPDWIQHLLLHAHQPDVGAAGGLLLYPDGTVQHAGVVVGMSGVADHVMRGFAADDDGYFGSLACVREVLALTAACLMLKKKDFLRLNGFDERFRTHFQDVDLCLRLASQGLRLVYTPRALLLHHESATRGHEYDRDDSTLLLELWSEVYRRGDPYYNPHFDRRCLNYSLRLE